MPDWRLYKAGSAAKGIRGYKLAKWGQHYNSAARGGRELLQQGVLGGPTNTLTAGKFIDGKKYSISGPTVSA